MIHWALSLALFHKTESPVFGAPAGREYARIVPGGTTILPNGRFLTPSGRRLYARENVWQVLTQGKSVVIFDEDGLTVHPDLNKVSKGTHIPVKGVAPAGCFSRDGSVLYVSRGEKGSIAAFDTAKWTLLYEIDANTPGTVGSYVNDMALSADDKLLYAVDVANQDLVTFDLTTKALKQRLKAGRQPYALALDRKSNAIYVANIGLFDYSVIPPTTDPAWWKEGLVLPPFGYPSPEARDGVDREGRFVPGLGLENAASAQSVYEYKVAKDGTATLQRSVKTGLTIRAAQSGREVVGGSSPNALLILGDNLFVSNANNDTVQQFRRKDLQLVRTIRLTPTPELEAMRGVIPSGLAASKDGRRIFVCESGLNAIAVIEVASGKVLGHIPTGWFPMQVRLAEDGKSLVVACHKGLGRGPQGAEGKRGEGDERQGLPGMPGMANIIPVPADREYKGITAKALVNNGLVPKAAPTDPNPIPSQPGKESEQIKYVVFITKENHTFDGIFGNLPGAKRKPDYAEFGEQGWIREKGKAERVPIMPNHIQLAKKFAISDNFYMEPQASGDGHRWLVGVYPSLWTSRVFYAGWDFRADDRNKGRLTSFGSNGSQIPEDYLENGSIWSTSSVAE